eukprot:1392345-Amorphochlora_amoeboformis.AAC.1
MNAAYAYIPTCTQEIHYNHHLPLRRVDSETLRKALSNVFATSSLLLDVFEDERVYTFPPHLLEVGALLKPIERRLLTIRTAYDHSKIALPARYHTQRGMRQEKICEKREREEGREMEMEESER